MSDDVATAKTASPVAQAATTGAVTIPARVSTLSAALATLARLGKRARVLAPRIAALAALLARVRG